MAGLRRATEGRNLAGMRQPRIKVDPAQAPALYHCMSRTVNGEWLFDEPAREVLRRQIHLVAEFTGLTVLTYAILSNHFHVLVKVPVKALRKGQSGNIRVFP